MKLIRKLLFPVAIIYWLVTYIRNVFYDMNWFKSTSFNIPIFVVGNLSVGGTGKTPHTEYLVRVFQDKFKTAVLSRGYKRKTKGYLLADDSVTSESMGDESFQIFKKFPKIKVAVSEDRKTGIQRLIDDEKVEVLLMDDAFQHRKVKAGFYILLTSYDDLFCDDFILPFGNLRESAMGKKRAHAIIVTKCSSELQDSNKLQIIKKLNVEVPIYFTSIVYDEYVWNDMGKSKLENFKMLEKNIIAGIAKPEYFVNYVKNDKDRVKIYPDHHNFSEQEISELNQLSKKCPILTTEKDYVRLKGKLSNLYYLPIKIKFLENEQLFINQIEKYVEANYRNN